MTAAELGHEAAALTGGASAASACGACLQSWGVDPSVSAVLAVVLGVAVRFGVDAVRSWMAARAARRSADG